MEIQVLQVPSYSPHHLVGSQLTLASHLSCRRFVTGAKEKEGHSPLGGGPATGESEGNKIESQNVRTGCDP